MDRSKLRPSPQPWMTAVEMSDFTKMRRDGAVSFFRSAKCAACSKEIHNTKQFCSKDCYEKSEENGTKT